jgi:hypothetical protein
MVYAEVYLRRDSGLLLWLLRLLLVSEEQQPRLSTASSPIPNATPVLRTAAACIFSSAHVRAFANVCSAANVRRSGLPWSTIESHITNALFPMTQNSCSHTSLRPISHHSYIYVKRVTIFPPTHDSRGHITNAFSCRHTLLKLISNQSHIHDNDVTFLEWTYCSRRHAR